MKVTVRLSPEDHDILQEVADDERIPVAVLLRNWAIAEMRRRKPERFSPRHEGDDDA